VTYLTWDIGVSEHNHPQDRVSNGVHGCILYFFSGFTVHFLFFSRYTYRIHLFLERRDLRLLLWMSHGLAYISA
jgi:hypothetical protein